MWAPSAADLGPVFTWHLGESADHTRAGVGRKGSPILLLWPTGIPGGETP